MYNQHESVDKLRVPFLHLGPSSALGVIVTSNMIESLNKVFFIHHCYALVIDDIQ